MGDISIKGKSPIILPKKKPFKLRSVAYKVRDWFEKTVEESKKLPVGLPRKFKKKK
jgi:hypothetical protein